MTMNSNKRRFERRDAVIDGTFVSREGRDAGQLMMTNVSRSGCRATLNRMLSAGQTLYIQARIPGRVFPVFASGTVVWAKPKNPAKTYAADIGIALSCIDALSRQRLSELQFAPWQMQYVGDFAQQQGYFARQGVSGADAWPCYLPLAGMAYVFLGALASVFNGYVAIVYLVSIAAGLCVLMGSVMRRLLRERADNRTFFDVLDRTSSLSAGILAASLFYGMSFIKGFFQSAPSAEN